MSTPENARSPWRAARTADRVIGAMTVLLVHEAGSLGGHIDELRMRLRVARRARGVTELLENQIDLLPDTRSRLRRDRSMRGELLRSLARR